MAINWKKVGKDLQKGLLVTNPINALNTAASEYLARKVIDRYTTPTKSTTKKKTSSLNNNYDSAISDYTKGLVGTGASGGSGGYYTLDINNMLKSYDQQAEADRAVAKQTYESRRNDLLTSLKRFQEQNAKDVERTQRAYLSDQASLESAIAQADRQNRINASARGLGGSGLQHFRFSKTKRFKYFC